MDLNLISCDGARFSGKLIIALINKLCCCTKCIEIVQLIFPFWSEYTERRSFFLLFAKLSFGFFLDSSNVLVLT